MIAAGIGTRPPGEDAGTEEEVVEAMHGAAYKNAPLAVEFLAEKGADINIWHNKNAAVWTPLIVARGYRWCNFRLRP